MNCVFLIVASLRESIRQQEVGFTAVKHNPLAVSEGATILFETTLTNIGSGYNPTKGVFTAPVDGMYVFSYNVECAKTNGDTYTELVHNGARLNMQAYCHGFGDSDNSGTMGILRLHAGDTIWIRLFDSDNRSFGWRTTFSGFLL